MFLVIFAIIGLYFLGESFTGFAIKETYCCFPPECEEYTCSGTLPEVQQMAPANYYSGFLGSLLVVILSLFLIFYLRRSS